MTTANEFQWNDELVREFYAGVQAKLNQGHSIVSAVEEFKKSNLPPVNEGVEVLDIRYAKYSMDNSINEASIIVGLSNKISKDKLPLIKIAISKCINEVGENKRIEKQFKDRYGTEKDSVQHITIVSVWDKNNRHLGYEVCTGINTYMTAFDRNGMAKLTIGEFTPAFGEDLTKVKLFPIPEPHFTFSQLNEERRKAFEAAREGKTFFAHEQKILSDGCSYKTFEDYLKTLNVQELP